MKKIFLICFSMLACVFDVNAALNCTQDVPAGKYCKTAGIKVDCRAGCYCLGNKTAIGSINVAKKCGERTDESGLNASGVYFCPPGTTSDDGAKSINDCYSIDGAGVLGKKPCVPGCFCVNNGQISRDFYGNHCSTQAQRISCGELDGRGWYFKNGNSRGMLSCLRNAYSTATYYVDEFSEVYRGDYGMYGFIGDNLIVMPFHPNYGGGIRNEEGIYQCPVGYPNSAYGAKTVYECYKYDASGNKVYYGTNTNITCAEGTYLPANSTQCVSCNASQNHVCPGGRFEKSDVIQGLKLNCPKGKYLPANATQCSACDESHYFCFGGIYDFSATMDQGLVTHNGYVNMGTHTFITCNPGYYIPANTNQCSACPGDYACPGGLFFTDSSYDVDRGNILCWYGTPNSTHTACMPKFAKPSLAKSSMQATSVSTQLTTNKNIDKDEIVTSVIADESYESDKTTSSSAPKDINENKISIFSLDEEGKEDTKNTKSDKKETKIDFGKVSISSDRAVTRRQESTSVSENNAISTKPIVHRSAKAIPQTSNSVQTDTTRERPDHIKRPSRGR